MSMSDGKLITLTNHVTVAADKQRQFPLSQLPYYFPISPTGDLTRGGTAQHNERSVIRRGVISQFGGPDLETISWDGELIVDEWFTNSSGGGAGGDPFAFFPDYFLRPPAGVNFYSAPNAYAMLKEIRDQGLVVVLKIQDLNTGEVETNMPVTLRSMEYTDKPGEPDHRFYSISFRQYRWLQIRKVDRSGRATSTSGSGGTARPSSGRFISAQYVTDKEYTLPALSQLAYHDRSQGDLIIRGNGGLAKMKAQGQIKLIPTANRTPRSGMYKIPKGVSLVIPALSRPAGIGTVPSNTPAPTRAS